MRGGSLLALALAGLAVPAIAAVDERTQLDEFALGKNATDPQVEQIDPAGGPLDTPVQPADRQVRIQQPAAGNPAPIVQLSRPDGGAEPDQVLEQTTPGVRVTSVSSKQDSRPEAAEAIAGTDRCDPQLERAELEECRRILERRAAEFDAPSAPVLSPEQRLLAEQEIGDRDAMGRSSASRLRLATLGDPDADLRSNQELAALYLPPVDTPDTPGTTGQPESDETLAEVLQDLVIQMQTGGVPTQ